jgi:hypothetical protein
VCSLRKAETSEISSREKLNKKNHTDRTIRKPGKTKTKDPLALLHLMLIYRHQEAARTSISLGADHTCLQNQSRSFPGKRTRPQENLQTVLLPEEKQ